MRTVFLALLLVVLAGCIGSDRFETHTISVDGDSLQFAEVELLLSTGNMTLTGGAEGLFEGEFTHQISDYKPHHEYEVETERERGHLIVEQPSIAQDTETGDHYLTAIRLGDTVPLDLTYTKREGNSDLQLTGLPLNSLSAELGEKDSTVDLSGDYPALTNVEIISGIGEDTITLNGSYPSMTNLSIGLEDEPDTVVVRGTYDVLDNLNLMSGDGEDAITINGQYPALTILAVASGAGDDAIALFGAFAEAPEITIDVGTGEDVVDLTGEWVQDLSITVISEENTATIRLPDNVGIRVEVINRTAEVNAAGFSQEGEVFINDLYGTADVTLSLRLNTTMGEVVNSFTLEIVSESE